MNKSTDLQRSLSYKSDDEYDLINDVIETDYLNAALDSNYFQNPNDKKEDDVENKIVINEPPVEFTSEHVENVENVDSSVCSENNILEKNENNEHTENIKEFINQIMINVINKSDDNVLNFDNKIDVAKKTTIKKYFQNITKRKNRCNTNCIYHKSAWPYNSKKNLHKLRLKPLLTHTNIKTDDFNDLLGRIDTLNVWEPLSLTLAEPESDPVKDVMNIIYNYSTPVIINDTKDIYLMPIIQYTTDAELDYAVTHAKDELATKFEILFPIISEQTHNSLVNVYNNRAAHDLRLVVKDKINTKVITCSRIVFASFSDKFNEIVYTTHAENKAISFHVTDVDIFEIMIEILHCTKSKYNMTIHQLLKLCNMSARAELYDIEQHCITNINTLFNSNLDYLLDFILVIQQYPNKNLVNLEHTLLDKLATSKTHGLHKILEKEYDITHAKLMLLTHDNIYKLLSMPGMIINYEEQIAQIIHDWTSLNLQIKWTNEPYSTENRNNTKLTSLCNLVMFNKFISGKVTKEPYSDIFLYSNTKKPFIPRFYTGELCSICNNPISESCPTCHKTPNKGGSWLKYGVDIVESVCNSFYSKGCDYKHAYHKHCVYKKHGFNSTCQLCEKPYDPILFMF
jgi:hypothetical protein